MRRRREVPPQQSLHAREEEQIRQQSQERARAAGALLTDAEVQHTIVDTLRADVRIDASNIQVDVQNGEARLKGTVPTPLERTLAAAAANRLKGVVRVVNDLQVAPTTPRTDEQLATEIRTTLAKDPWIDEQRITVSVVGGVAYLTGTVESPAARAYAEGDAWSVRGVVEVVNQLVVVPPAARADIEIVGDVREALARHPQIISTDIEVSAVDGTVTLRGTVHTLEQKWVAEDIARWVVGVRDVVDEITVRSG